MKRFRRIAFNVLAGVSALLCVATVALWVRSHWRHDDLTIRRAADAVDAANIIEVESEFGALSVEYTRRFNGVFLTPINSVDFSHSPYRPEQLRDHSYLPPEWSFDFSSFWVIHPLVIKGYSGKTDFIKRSAAFPDWFLVVLFAVLPALWLYLRRRRPVGLCLSCGYDLRATPDDQGRYPLNYAP